MEFEWDSGKARANISKHGVSFLEASEAFGDALSYTIPDPDHSNKEERFVLFGASRRGKCLVVCFTERDARIRIVSARKMTRRERTIYEQ